MRNFLPLCSVALAAVTSAACMDDPTAPAVFEPGPRFDVHTAAANIVVITDDDAGDGVTTCTLREAIQAATIDAAVGVCAAGSAAMPDVIGFDAALDGATITLGGTRLEIEGQAVVDAGGKRITVSGDDASQVFYIAANAEVTLRGLTITGGTDAGAPFSERGAGIHVRETEPVEDTTRLTLDAVTLTGNHGTSFGGGIHATFRTAVTVINSTISGNTAVDFGGGIFSRSKVAIINTTVTGNSAGNAGGLGLDGLTGFGTIENSIIAGNTATDVNDPPDCAGAFTTGGHNVLGEDAGCPIGADDVGIAAADVFTTVLDESLADNGGPTATHALLDPAATGSANPAVDIGGTCGPTDQRGFTSPAGAACDAGAFELGGAVPPPMGDLVVNSLDDADDGTCDITHCSLREAIAAAEDGDEITFDLTLPGTIELGGSQLTIGKQVTITGPGADLLAVDANGQSRVLHVQETGDVTISGITIRGGSADDGAGVWSAGRLAIRNSTIRDNDAFVNGGGIFHSGHLMVWESTIRDNSAGNGGGVHVDGDGDATIENSTISSNTSTALGGGIASLGDVTVRNSTISGNTATQGGGIIIVNGTSMVENSTISDNGAGRFGGIYSFGPSAVVMVTTTILGGNTAAGSASDCGDESVFGFASGGNNLIGVVAECTLDDTDLRIDPAVVFTNVLGPLGENGGPTLTHALLDPAVTGRANPAIDQGICAAELATDQRGEGFPRVIDVPSIDNAEGGNGCDIGAFEFAPSNAAPLADAGADQTVECEADGCAEVTLDGSGSSDPDGDALTFHWTDADGNTVSTEEGPTLELELGTHVFTLVVDDGTAESAPDQVEITVQDLTAPLLTVGSSSAVLWPANHKYRTVALSDLGLTVNDACDASLGGSDAVITKVTSDEPEDAPGGADGGTSDDIVIRDCRTVWLRAQRDESGNGRVYTLHLEVTDASGNSGTATYQVTVPVARMGSAVDDGDAGYTVEQAATCPAGT